MPQGFKLWEFCVFKPLDTNVYKKVRISPFVSCNFSWKKDSMLIKEEGGDGMNPKKMGIFLKTLRKEKNITQEQFAEIIGVSARTVSRWETGTNMPDLSILIQISEYYDVEIKEIINGEREGENMKDELKETLLKVADYNELERQKAATAGNTAFGITFIVCAITIVVQILMKGDLSMVVGETLILIIGGIAYLKLIVRSGAWEGAVKIKNTRKNNMLISAICSGVFSIILYIMLMRKSNDSKIVWMTVIFFVVIMMVSYILQRVLIMLNKKQKE